jgi:hypothetical protein
MEHHPLFNDSGSELCKIPLGYQSKVVTKLKVPFELRD